MLEFITNFLKNTAMILAGDMPTFCAENIDKTALSRLNYLCKVSLCKSEVNSTLKEFKNYEEDL